MKSIARTSVFVQLTRLSLTLFVALASLPACVSPRAINYDVPVPFNMPAQLPPGVEPLPIKIGVYYSSEFKQFKHFDRTFGNSGVTTPVGGFSVRQFDSMLSAMFQHPWPVARRPPYAAGQAASQFAGTIEPRIERFELNIATLSTGPFTARVDYQFKLYSADGATIATWKISASDTASKGMTETGVDFNRARTEAVVRKASMQFMQEFSDSPKVKKWLAKLSEEASGAGQLTKNTDADGPDGDTLAGKKMAKAPDAAFDVNAGALASGATAVLAGGTLNGVDINARLHWHMGFASLPIQTSTVKSDVFAVHLTITNSRTESVVFDPSKLRLKTNRSVTLTPDSARIVAQRMLHDAGTDNAAVNQFLLGPFFGSLASMSEADAKDEAVNKLTDRLNREQLDNRTIAPNQSVSGNAYFIALGIERNLDSPELQVHIAIPSRSKSYETFLDMTSGAATGSTLLLAGSKRPGSVVSDVDELTATLAALKLSLSRGELSDEEYMQKQRAVVNEYTGNSRTGSGIEASSSSKGRWRVALFPSVHLTGPSDSSRGEILYDFVHEYVGRHQNLELVFSDYDARFESGLAGTEAENWTGTLTQRTPNNPQIVRGAKKVDADLAVLISFKKRMSGWGSYDDFVFSIYVMDVEDNRMYTKEGTDFDYKKVIEDAFKRVLKDGLQNAPRKISQSEYLRVAILPFATRDPSSTNVAGGDLERFSREFLGRRSGLKLTYSYYQPELGGGPVLDLGSLWEGYVQKLPRKSEVYAVAGKLDADVALTFSHAPRTADGYAYELYSADVYVFDLEYERMYHDSGDERNYKGITERLVEQLIADRKSSAGKGT